MGESAEALTSEILADARRQAERTRRKAERRAEKIASEARDRADRERRRILQEAREKAEQEGRRIEALIPQQVDFIRSEAVDELLEHCRRRALEKLRGMVGTDDYGDVLCALAVAAIDQMSGEKFRLLLTKRDRQELGEDVADRVAAAAREELDRDVEVEVADRALDASGGLQVMDERGRQICDETFEARLERLWPELRHQVAEKLAGGDVQSLLGARDGSSDG